MARGAQKGHRKFIEGTRKALSTFDAPILHLLYAYYARSCRCMTIIWFFIVNEDFYSQDLALPRALLCPIVMADSLVSSSAHSRHTVVSLKVHGG